MSISPIPVPTATSGASRPSLSFLTPRQVAPERRFHSLVVPAYRPYRYTGKNHAVPLAAPSLLHSTSGSPRSTVPSVVRPGSVLNRIHTYIDKRTYQEGREGTLVGGGARIHAVHKHLRVVAVGLHHGPRLTVHGPRPTLAVFVVSGEMESTPFSQGWIGTSTELPHTVVSSVKVWESCSQAALARLLQERHQRPVQWTGSSSGLGLHKAKVRRQQPVSQLLIFLPRTGAACAAEEGAKATLSPGAGGGKMACRSTGLVWWSVAAMRAKRAKRAKRSVERSLRPW